MSMLGPQNSRNLVLYCVLPACLSGMLFRCYGNNVTPQRFPMRLWATSRPASSACVAALLVSIGAFGAPASAQETSAGSTGTHLRSGRHRLPRTGRPARNVARLDAVARRRRLRTQNGRVEVLFADGATLHLDNASTVDFQSDEVIRLLEGRVRLTIPGPPRRVSYRIDAAAGWAEIQQPGEYRVAVTATVVTRSRPRSPSQ